MTTVVPASVGKPLDFDKMERKRAFGKRLDDIRKRRGFSQTDLAKAVGIGRGSISEYIGGHAMPRTDTLEALARVLKVDVEALVPDFDSSAAHSEFVKLEPIRGPKGMTILQVNRTVSLATAARVLVLLEDEAPIAGAKSDEASDAK